MHRSFPSHSIASLACAIALSTSSTALAQDTVWAAAAAVDGTITPAVRPHGIVLASMDRFGLRHGARASVEYNTDTLRVTWEDLQPGPSWLSLGVRATGQALFAGVLVDAWRDGVNDLERGIFASYAMGEAWAKFSLGHHQYLDVAVGGRRWFFGPSGATDPAFVLPEDAWVFEPRLRYTLWRLHDDRSLRERHRMLPRVTGFALGVQLGMDVRSAAAPWGLGLDDGATGGPQTDPRNRPETAILHVRQWMRGGVPIARRVRLQALQVSAWGRGEDDLTRDRLGGMTPYVVPIAGAGWPAWLSERHVSGEVSMHVRVGDDSEVGLLTNAAYLADPRRTGSSPAGGEAGVGAFADVRHGPWQAHVRAGYSPTVSRHEGPSTSIFVAVGTQWRTR
jgi:hypothetical protein